RRQQRLLCLEQTIEQLPRSVDASNRQDQFLRQLDTLPRTALADRPWPRRPRNWALWPLTAAALLFLTLGVGWLANYLGNRGGRSGAVVQTQSRPPATDRTQVAQAVIGRVLEHDLRLAEAVAARDQFHALAEMAADLRSEALRLAQRGAREDLELVS